MLGDIEGEGCGHVAKEDGRHGHAWLRAWACALFTKEQRALACSMLGSVSLGLCRMSGHALWFCERL
jgi:hypothetical protein